MIFHRRWIRDEIFAVAVTSWAGAEEDDCGGAHAERGRCWCGDEPVGSETVTVANNSAVFGWSRYFLGGRVMQQGMRRAHEQRYMDLHSLKVALRVHKLAHHMDLCKCKGWLLGRSRV
jgi:hypothetical protein